MTKQSIQEEGITILNISVSNTGSPKYIKQILTDIKGKINSNTIIVGDFDIPLSSMDRSSRQKVNEETQTLNNTLDQMDPTDIYRAFYLKAADYTLFSSAQGTFSRIDHMLDHKVSLSNLGKLKLYYISFLIILL